jgi:hypothetical protein
MACQQVCPENKSRLKTRPSGVEFTAEETAAVLEAGRWLGTGEGRDEDAKASDRKAGLGEAQGGSAALASARAKFDRLGMSEDLEIMGRNLGYFLKRR